MAAVVAGEQRRELRRLGELGVGLDRGSSARRRRSRTARRSGARTTACRRCRSRRPAPPTGTSSDGVEEGHDARRGWRRAARRAGSSSVMVSPFRWAGSSYAPEADVAHAGVDHLRPARGRPVAQAVGVGAQVGAALDHLARRSGTAAGPGRSSPRGRRRAGSPARSTAMPASSGCRLVHQSSVHSQTLPAMSKSPNPLAGKLPTGAVREEAALAGAAPREVGPVPGVGHDPAAGPRLVAPGERRARRGRRARRTPTRPRSAARRRPRSRTPSASSWATCTTGWSSRLSIELAGPLGCCQQAPGFQRHHWLRWRRSTGPRVGVKTIEPGLQVLRRRVRVVGRVERPLGDGDVAGGVDERRELARWSPRSRRSRRRRPAPGGSAPPPGSGRRSPS